MEISGACGMNGVLYVGLKCKNVMKALERMTLFAKLAGAQCTYACMHRQIKILTFLYTSIISETYDTRLPLCHHSAVIHDHYGYQSEKIPF